MNFPYIESNLLKDEKITYGVRPHPIIFASGFSMIALALYVWLFPPQIFSSDIFNNWSLQSLIVLAAFVVGIYWLIRAYIYYATSEYVVTNKRVVIKIGWITRVSLELLLDKVEGVLVDQSVFGRIFNYGVITIIGTGGTKDSFPFIPDPLLFRKMVQQAVSDFEATLGKRG